jgi:hypothetical protein
MSEIGIKNQKVLSEIPRSSQADILVTAFMALFAILGFA